MKDVSVYVDESGIISKNPSGKTKYFVITMIFVQDCDIEHVKKIFKKYRLKVVKKNEELMKKLKQEGEIKGSELSESDKKYIYSKVIEKCGDKFQLGIILLDNEYTDEKFRKNSSRAFNYLIKIYLRSFFKKSILFENLDSLKFYIDERNVAAESRYTLQEYLNTELNLTEHFCNGDITVHYYDSKKYILLQMADFISNTVYRKYQKKQEDCGNVEQLIKKSQKMKVFKFPRINP